MWKQYFEFKQDNVLENNYPNLYYVGPNHMNITATDTLCPPFINVADTLVHFDANTILSKSTTVTTTIFILYVDILGNTFPKISKSLMWWLYRILPNWR